MIISQVIELDQPIDSVWNFFGDLAQVAPCIPGANLNDKMPDGSYQGDVIISAGPVKLEFAGVAKIISRDQTKRVTVIDAKGADKKGRGNADALLTINLASLGGGTKATIALDLQVSGAAAQYGRGLINDVTAVLVNQTASSAQARIKAISLGLDPNSVAGPKAASGLAIGLNAFSRAAVRVFGRFFFPYKPLQRR